MGAYAQLLATTRGGVAEAPAVPLPTELELQALWFAGAFGREFTDSDGRSVRIVQFGEWNRGAGPDFLHGAVEIDGETHTGAIELDTEPADWEAHGHGADPAFNGVVLHVVFRDSPVTSFTRTSEHRAVPRVRLSAEALEAVLQLPVREVAIARPGRCVHPLAGLSESSVQALLRQAAEHRAALKTRRFLHTTDAHGRDAALFQSVAESLGYRANALPMRLLAQRMPLAALKENTEAIPALLFGVAGFLSPDLHEKAPPDTRDYLRNLWDTWWKHRDRWESRQPLPWKMHGQRPANHPHRRVAALAALAANWPAFRQRALGRPFDPKKVMTFLAELNDPFWTHRHTLSSRASDRPVALFGKSQAIEFVANHAAPLALHEDPEFGWDELRKLPAGAKNEKVRRCAIRLFGSEETAGPWLRKAAHHQALLQIYHDFCLEDVTDCHNCPFPEQLSQWDHPEN
ncbi:hypothetical protein HAHE_28390 [Haloferula helveola]|uniref:DUF2851 family protein n=1 Tax=Haloferula helveola TaxID=490095 RepID=A0ABN6H5J2_9BACT|nr:hypothetical protein HAHE_28390 [Haloferula helveola]